MKKKKKTLTYHAPLDSANWKQKHSHDPDLMWKKKKSPIGRFLHAR